MLNVTLLLIMFVCIFAILGVQLFSGLMYRCNDDTVSGVEECIGTYEDEFGVETVRVWSRPFHNFDNLGRALLTLFVCSSLVRIRYTVFIDLCSALGKLFSCAITCRTGGHLSARLLSQLRSQKVSSRNLATTTWRHFTLWATLSPFPS